MYKFVCKFIYIFKKIFYVIYLFIYFHALIILIPISIDFSVAWTVKLSISWIWAGLPAQAEELTDHFHLHLVSLVSLCSWKKKTKCQRKMKTSCTKLLIHDNEHSQTGSVTEMLPTVSICPNFRTWTDSRALELRFIFFQDIQIRQTPWREPVACKSTHGFSCTSESQKSSSRSSQRSVEPSHSSPCLSALHTWSCRRKHRPSVPTRRQPCVCVCVCALPAGAALLHDLGSVVTGQFAEAIVAVDDGPVDDLSVSQHEVCVWAKKPAGENQSDLSGLREKKLHCITTVFYPSGGMIDQDCTQH